MFKRPWFKHARVTPTGIAVGVVATLVIGSGTAWAAPKARGLLVGKKNTVTKVTTLTNPKGTPLQLNSGRSQPPLKVNSTRKVPKLNADYLDGLSEGSFARSNGRTGIIVTRGGDENVSNHAYAVAEATCPAGTVLTGGGGFASYDDDHIWYSGPGMRPNTWEVDSDGDGAADTGKELVAYAVCYNPRGAVKGAYTFPQLHALKTQLSAGRR